MPLLLFKVTRSLVAGVRMWTVEEAIIQHLQCLLGLGGPAMAGPRNCKLEAARVGVDPDCASALPLSASTLSPL